MLGLQLSGRSSAVQYDGPGFDLRWFQTEFSSSTTYNQADFLHNQCFKPVIGDFLKFNCFVLCSQTSNLNWVSFRGCVMEGSSEGFNTIG